MIHTILTGVTIALVLPPTNCKHPVLAEEWVSIKMTVFARIPFLTDFHRKLTAASVFFMRAFCAPPHINKFMITSYLKIIVVYLFDCFSSQQLTYVVSITSILMLQIKLVPVSMSI